MNTVEIKKYTKNFKEEVISLILEIQQKEFEIPISIADQPDLEDVENFYQKGAGNFWVASINNTVVGTIALLDIGNAHGALRKMFVKKEFRGKDFNIGQRLLNMLFAWSRENRLKNIYLGTTEKFLAAHRFYEKNNFIEIDKELLPTEFPIMGVDVKFYECSISSRFTAL